VNWRDNASDWKSTRIKPACAINKFEPEFASSACDSFGPSPHLDIVIKTGAQSASSPQRNKKPFIVVSSPRVHHALGPLDGGRKEGNIPPPNPLPNILLHSASARLVFSVG
jgi:hypothetical protein